MLRQSGKSDPRYAPRISFPNMPARAREPLRLTSDHKEVSLSGATLSYPAGVFLCTSFTLALRGILHSRSPSMLAIAHTITSAAVGVAVPNAPFAFAISFLLHLFLDTFLHWNLFYHRHRPFFTLVALDLCGGLLIVFLLLGRDAVSAPVLAAIIGGNLPDVVGLPSILLKKTNYAFHRFHERLQLETTSLRRGILSQVIAIVVALALIRLI